MKKSIHSLILALVFVLGSATGSCELIEKALACICEVGATGNPKIDGFFASSQALLDASARVQAKVDLAVRGLAEAVGHPTPATATPAEVSQRVCDAFAAASVSFNLTYEPPECKADVDVAVDAYAECEVVADPGSVQVECSGSCEGTCRAQCTGECRMPNVEAACSGECHGSCAVEVSGDCRGTCRGTCSGACSATNTEGQCAGSCEGTCEGHCEVNVEGSCSGTCKGECTVTADPGGCNGRCEGTCEGRCEGGCSGTVDPPEMSAECEAQVQARAEASVECEPPKIEFGADTSAITNIAKINAQLGQIFAATAEAEVIFDALGAYASSAGSMAEAMINGELDPEQAICMIDKVQTSTAALQAATAAINAAVSVSAEMLTCS